MAFIFGKGSLFLGNGRWGQGVCTCVWLMCSVLTVASPADVVFPTCWEYPLQNVQLMEFFSLKLWSNSRSRSSPEQYFCLFLSHLWPWDSTRYVSAALRLCCPVTPPTGCLLSPLDVKFSLTVSNFGHSLTPCGLSSVVWNCFSLLKTSQLSSKASVLLTNWRSCRL